MSDTKELTYLGDYINNEFTVPADPDAQWDIYSPGDLKDKVMTLQCRYSHIDQACLAAKAAFPSWAKMGLEKRKEYLVRLKEVYLKHADSLAEIISRETGKPLWDSKNEVKAMVGKIDITLGHSLRLVSEERIENALPQIDGVIRHKPRGVMAVIGPFNFPGHLPNGHIIPALVMGNTVVFKPSDKTAAVGQKMAEMFHEAEFPTGVFNLLQGQGETGKRLCEHEHIDGVLFTGSYEVGLKIKQATLHHHWKILALEMGGKNSTIVWEDADLEKAVYETLIGAFLTTGQRCSGTSKVILHKKIKAKFLDNFYASAKKLVVDHWSKNPFMGPLISADAVEKYIRFQEIAKREGAESIMRGKALSLEKEGYYVTPSIYTVPKFDPKSVYQNNEIFGPNVAIFETDDFSQAMQITNASGFGLVAALFTKNKDLYQRALLEAKVGLLNWNRTTNGASSKLPFGGMGRSGNDRPSADFAVQYCSVPVSSLEDHTQFDPKAIMPGIDYEFKG